jgi:hypothetical protein
MSEVLVQMARSGWINHKEGPAGFESPVDVLQNLGWVSEVVSLQALLRPWPRSERYPVPKAVLLSWRR